MKHINKLVFAALAMAALILGMVVPAWSQVTPTTIIVMTNIPAAILASSTSNFTSVVAVRQNRAMQIAPYFAAASASTSTITLDWQFSLDGTNYTTEYPFISAHAASGTTAVRGWTNIPAATLDGVLSVKLAGIINAVTNTVYITNIVIVWRN